MLDSAGNDLAFVRQRRQCAFDGRIVALRAAARKYNFARVAAQQTRHLFACLSNIAAYLPAECVHARRVAVKLAEQRLHFLEHFFGYFCCRVIVKIYGLHFLSCVMMLRVNGFLVFLDVKFRGHKFPQLRFHHVL